MHIMVVTMELPLLCALMARQQYGSFNQFISLHMHSKVFIHFTLHLLTGQSFLFLKSACIRVRPAAIALISCGRSALKLNGHG